jgi:hypothetical protein
MLRISFLALTGAMAMVLPAASAESVLSSYRGVALGDSVQTVVERLQLAAADVKVIQERPTTVQEVTWRPHRFVSGATVEPDPLSEIVVTFHAGRVARIAVAYDRERTKGMTDADLRDALESVYGVSMLIGLPTQPAVNLPSERKTIGRWQDAETLLLLWRGEYPNRIGITITSVAGDAAFQQAIADGTTLHAAEAPARDLARRTAEAAAIQARDEKTRLENKAKFKP